MNEDYNNIELTEEEMAGLENLTETTESPTDDNASEVVEESTEATEEETSNGVTEPEVADGLEIDGTHYSQDQILKWREDSTNKNNWQKSNTEKAQKLSKWNKLADKINDDESFRNHIKDFLHDNPEAVTELGLDDKIPVEEMSETPSEVDLRLNALETIESGRLMEHRVNQLDGQLTDLEKANPDYLGNQDKVSEFLDFADKNSSKFIENGMPNLERAFREWSYDQMQEQLTHFKKLEENGKRNTGIINKSEAGAKEVKADKKPTTWNDISMDDPSIAKYFDK
jgi:hypothetical protein